MHKSRNRMREVAVNWGNAITGKGKKCIKLVIESSVDVAKRQFYYEKSALGEKSRNRIHRYNRNKDSLPIYLRSESLFFVC